MTSQNSKIEPRILKGFTDYLPHEARARQVLFDTVRSIFERYGFDPMSTPALEYKDILLNKYGEDEKLVYSFTDHGGRAVALRYDLTVPLARFVALHQHELTFPFKRYQIAPVWRAENTQKGRLREFYQCDIDIVGSESALADAEVIACICAALKELGLEHFLVRINDRGIFNVLSDHLHLDMAASAQVLRSIDKFYKIGAEGVVAELAEAGIATQALGVIKTFLQSGTNHTALEALQRLLPHHDQLTAPISTLFNILKQLGVPEKQLVFDPLIARGLDYYTGTVFEITLTNEAGGSIAAGGRYNSLLDQFSKNPLPAVGGSIGIDRIVELLGYDMFIRESQIRRIIIFNLEADNFTEYLNLLARLRKAGVNAELFYEPAKMDKQFKYAEQRGHTHAVIYGRQEHLSGQVQIKTLSTREQRSVALEDIVRILTETP